MPPQSPRAQSAAKEVPMSEAFPSRPDSREEDFDVFLEAGGTERRRSRSGVPPASLSPELPLAGSPTDHACAQDDEPYPPNDDVPESNTDADEGLSVQEMPDEAGSGPTPLPWQPGSHKKRGRRLVKPQPALTIGPEQRLLLLDIWKRSALPAGDFAALVGLSKHTLYAWKKRF